MKLRYLFAAIASSLCVFAACTQDEPVSLETIQLDKTYLAIPPAGGDAKLKVKSTVPWALSENIVIGKDADKKDIKAQLPTWLTATAVSGEAGEKEVTFHADACDYGREQLFQIEVGKQLQYFIVRQGEMTIEETSIADALAAPDGKSFRLTGVVTEKYNNYEKYGNFYISDGKDKILIYGIADKDGKFGNNPIASWGIEIGDELTLEGPRGSYNGSPQMVNCTVIKLVKALLQIDASSFDIPKEGDDIVVTASFKGNGVMIKSAPDWISLSSTEYVAGVPSKLEPNPADKNILTFHVAPNDGVKPRTGEIVLASTAGKNTSEQTVTVTQAPNAPALMTIAEALQTDYVHIKGTVMAICTRGYVLADATGAILCYYGSKFDATQYKIGDVIEVVHGISAYNYGPQLSCDGEGKVFDLEEKISEGTGEVTYPTPSIIGPDELEDLVASISGKDGKKVSDAIKMEYVQVTATPKKSSDGKYVNLFVDGYDAADFSAYNLPASFDLNAMLDKKVTVRGYTQSISGNKHLNIVFTELIEGEAETPVVWINESFAEDQGDFTFDILSIDPALTWVWSYDTRNHCVKASAFKSSVAYAAEALLVSPEIDLTDASHAYWSFDHVGNYFNGSTDFVSHESVWVKKGEGEWEKLPDLTVWYTGADWNWVNTGDIDISAYVGGKVKLGVKYTSTTALAPTVEVKNVMVKNYPTPTE